MDILDVIKTRRSIRRFESKEVPPGQMEMILEAGRWAPSGLNNQPWRFALVTDVEVRMSMSKLTHYSRILKDAQFLIAVFLDTGQGYDRTKDVQAVGACLQNMLLEAHSLGLGGVWLGEIIKNSSLIMELLGLDAALELMAVLAFGYPHEEPRNVTRRPLSELIVFKK